MLEAALTGGLFALLLSLALTPIVRQGARRFGYVAHPRHDRWHQTPTALFGGVGIYLAFVIPFAALYDHDRSMLFLMASATIVFGLGIVDDLYPIQPYTKLLVQIAAAGVATFGAFIPSHEGALLLVPLAIFGLVALTNAFNLLDNMDGLSAGTACIAAFFLFFISLTMQHMGVAICAAILFGATLGFLFYNFNPATIFMGDSGSMFLGFLLAALTMKGNWEEATNLLLMVLTPLLVLAVPIFDTTFVTLVRWINGRAISQGGRDHTSHRLVTFGLSERMTVGLFYLLSIVCGTIAFFGVLYNALTLSLLGTLVVIMIFYLGMFLSGVVIYGTEREVTTRPASDRGVVLNIFLTHKRRLLEILIDMVLVCLAYGLSFVIRFDGYVPLDLFRLLVQSMPLIVPLKLLAFASFDLYRGVWRYVGMRDLIAIFKAVTVGSILSILVVTVIYRSAPLPRSVFAIDWMALLLLVAGVRVLVHIIREYLVSLAEAKGKRVVIVGAGDAGELVLRELRNNARLGCVPVGFFDDDPDKRGRRIHGVPVLGGIGMIHETVTRLGVDQIMVAIPSAQAESLAGIVKICKSTGLLVTVMPALTDVFQEAISDDQQQVSPWVPRADSHGIAKGQTWN